MRTHAFTISEFYCTKCGNKGIPIGRPVSLQREFQHYKKLYCLHCREEVNHVEIRAFDHYSYEDFKKTSKRENLFRRKLLMRKKSVYNQETGEAIFKIVDKTGVYVGKAKVHPEDDILASKLTGLTIAELRARIKRENSKKRKKILSLKEKEKELSQIRKEILFYEKREEYFQTILDDYLQKKLSFQEKLKRVIKKREEAKQLCK